MNHNNITIEIIYTCLHQQLYTRLVLYKHWLNLNIPAVSYTHLDVYKRQGHEGDVVYG